jgi:hypothetical protein
MVHIEPFGFGDRFTVHISAFDTLRRVFYGENEKN